MKKMVDVIAEKECGDGSLLHHYDFTMVSTWLRSCCCWWWWWWWGWCVCTGVCGPVDTDPSETYASSGIVSRGRDAFPIASGPTPIPSSTTGRAPILSERKTLENRWRWAQAFFLLTANRTFADEAGYSQCKDHQWPDRHKALFGYCEWKHKTRRQQRAYRGNIDR